MARTKGQRWTEGRHYRWAQEWRSLFESIFPASVCETAMATCRIQLRGLDSHGNKWGKGFVTLMQTFGHTPIGLTNDVQIRENWIELDAHDSANLILDCFGMSVDDVYRQFGEPGKGERLELNLSDVVTAIDADFATTAAVAAVA